MRAWWVVTALLAGCGDVSTNAQHDAAPTPDSPAQADAMQDAATCAAIPTGQVGWWPADQNANDSGGTHNGVANGASFSYTPGKHGFAFQLNGASQYVTIDDADAMWPITSFSLEAWVKTTAAGGEILVKYQCANYCPGSAAQAYFGLSIGGGKPAFEFRSDADSNITQIAATLTTVNDGQWHHVVGVRDNTAMQGVLYVDGQVEATSNLTTLQLGSMTNQDGEVDPVIIGASITGGTNTFNAFFAGAIDDVAIYHSALSASQVAALYAAPDGKCN